MEFWVPGLCGTTGRERQERGDTKTKGIFHFQEREDPGTEKLFRFQGLKKFSRTWNIYHAQRIPEQRNNSYNIWE